MENYRNSLAVDVEIAQKALHDVWDIPRFGGPPSFPDVSSTLDELWVGTAVDNESWRLSLHSLFILRCLVFAHRESGDARYLEKGKEILESWIRQNPRDRPPCTFSWSDHSTALRAVLICAFLDYYDRAGGLDARFQATVAHSLLQHGLFLIRPENYAYSHNHGIYQDYALLVVATHLKEGTVSREWVSAALSRLEKQLAQTYSTRGIHLENSPGYHQSITELLDRIARYLGAVGIGRPERLLRTLDLAKGALPSFILPDFTIVPVGDTGRGDRARIGSQLPADDRFVVHPEGYAVISGSMHAFFAATCNSLTHKHCDDLSLVLYDREGGILVDPGFLNYQLNDARRNYTLSWPAHNTVTVASEPPLAISRRCGIDAYGRTDRFVVLRGSSIRTTGQVHTRTLIYDIENESLIIMDLCKSMVSERWYRFFHFDPQTTLLMEADHRIQVQTSRDKRYILALWPTQSELRLIAGQENPIQGWVADSFGDLSPAPVTAESLLGADLVFLAAIGPQDASNSIRLTPDKKIAYKGRSQHREISLAESHIEITSDPVDSSAQAGQANVETVPLQANKYQDPFLGQRRPVGLDKRLTITVANIVCWIVVLSLIRFIQIRRPRFAIVLLLFAIICNVIVLIKFFDRLAWY